MPEFSQKLVWAILGIMLLGFAFLGDQFLALKHRVDAAIVEHDVEVEGKHECGTPVEYNGYEYRTIRIGDQCWFAENLRSENYDNGDAIPSNLSNSEWDITQSGAVAVYNESASYLDTFGRLYNYHAVDDSRGLCPNGWHVPSDGEWTVMTDFVDNQIHMKTTYGWNDDMIPGTNSSGFSGLPGGFRGEDNFAETGNFGYWWSSSSYSQPELLRSSSPYSFHAWCRVLARGYTFDFRSIASRQHGFSVRCVRDAE